MRYIGQDSAGQLQIMWEPPKAVNELVFRNINIDFRITHYIISIITEDLMTTRNISGTSFSIDISNMSCSLMFQVVVVNSAGMGEPSPSQVVDCEL